MSSRIMIKDIETALDIYYKYPEIGTPEIMRLFGCGRSTAGRLKNSARAVQNEQGKMTFSPLNVNTKCAFEAWHIDINDIERSVMKLRKFRDKLAAPTGAHAKPRPATVDSCAFENRDL